MLGRRPRATCLLGLLGWHTSQSQAIRCCVSWEAMYFHRRCAPANGPAARPHTMLASQQRSLPRCNNLLFCPTSCRCSCPAALDPDGGRAAWSSTWRQSSEKLDKTSAPRGSSSQTPPREEFHLVTPTHINMQRVPRSWICNLKGMAVSRCKILNNLWGDK